MSSRYDDRDDRDYDRDSQYYGQYNRRSSLENTRSFGDRSENRWGEGRSSEGRSGEGRYVPADPAVAAMVAVAAMAAAAAVAVMAVADTAVAVTVAAATVAAEENLKDTAAKAAKTAAVGPVAAVAATANHRRVEDAKVAAKIIGAAAGRTTATMTGAKADTAATVAQALNVVTVKA
jgi:hypothetical protein